jgi:DNA polymerase-3 subunit epsilon/ATP-dependent DNA helicase DinG
MLQAQGMRFPQPAYDTFDMATLLMPRAPAYRLGALAAAIGITHDEAQSLVRLEAGNFLDE